MWPARSSALRTRASSLAALIVAFAAVAPATAAPPDPVAGKAKAAPCFACHGEDGNSVQPAIPSLAAQPPLYVFYQLIQFREERRKDPLMSPFAAKLTDQDMKDIAAYFSALPARVPDHAPDPAQIEAGKAIAARNHCDSCHASKYEGQKHIGRLAGQHYEYLVKQLRGFKTGARPDIDGSMASAAQPLNDADILAMAAYLSKLP
jgi:cytochrome c553